jgi:flagellar biosynthetic protein FliR
MAGFPIFGFEVAPIPMRVLFAVSLSIAMTASLGSIPMPESLAMAAMGEFVTGAFLGLLVRTAMAAIEIAGEAAGVQMGFGFQKSMNPLSKEQNGPVTNLLFAIAGVLVFVSGAHLETIKGLALSFQALPPGVLGFTGDVELLVFDVASDMLASGFRMCLPLMIVALLTQLSFGFLTRVAPQLNVWALGFAFMIGVGFIALLLFSPFLVREITATIDRGIETFLFTAAEL